MWDDLVYGKCDKRSSKVYMYVTMHNFCGECMWLCHVSVEPRGVHCTKHVRIYVSAQKGY